MRFLTRETYDSWYGPLNPFEDSSLLDAAYARYTQHLKDLESVLPSRVIELARLPGVDDGLVVEVHHVVSQDTLQLILRCGDSQMGYYDLLLTYEGAIISPQDQWTLAKIARTTMDAWHHEFDLFFHEVDQTSEGQIEHRLLFHDWVWFGIRCKDLHWTQVSRPDRELSPLPDRFPGGPISPRRRLKAEPPRR